MYFNGKLNLKAYGEAVKEARKLKGWERGYFAELIGLSSKQVQYIETKGAHTSLQKYFEILAHLGVCADPFVLPDKPGAKSPQRVQIDAMLDGMEAADLHVIHAAVKALTEAAAMR